MFVGKRNVRILVEFAMSQLTQAPIDEQIKIYQALGDAMPTAKERALAKEIALSLSRASALELEFSNKLLNELQWPGHKHNGPKKGDGH